MNRRKFLSTAPLATLASDAAAPSLAAQQTSDAGEFHYVNRRQGAHPFKTANTGKRPHIFLICLDMVSPDHFLPSRSLQREMEMPAIRALTAEGVNFTNAFCTVPICSPSRASMYTGRYPYVLANPGGGPEGQENSLRANDVIYPEYLKASGYRTRHVGKNHVGAQKFMDAFDELDTNWERAMPVLKDDGLYHSYLRRLGVRMPRYSRQIHRLYPDRKTPSGTLGGWIEQSDGRPFPLEGQYSWYLSQWAIEKTRDAFASGGPNAPLYLQLNIYDPHNPFTIPAGFEKREAELRKAISLPASFRRAVERNFQPAPGEPALLDFHRRVWGIYRPETAKDYMVANALAMEVIDRALAQFIKALKEMNIYDESLIIFTADHGEMNIHQALVDKGAYLHPETQRVPLVIKPPASFGARPATVDAPVSLLDLAATVCDAAGVVPLARMDGRSLLPHVRGQAEAGDRDLLFQTGWLATGNPACGTERWERGGRHHFFVHNMGSTSDELYDLNDADAGSIAADPAQKKVLDEMAQRTYALLEKDARWSYYRLAFRFQHYTALEKA
ncbi:MAG: sulfatase-like hydrolase/transferase [Bryobacterales bacterium]|nr:sulfatase-like hydrolase/transferase [Bryobacterales bacterium]